LLTLRPYRLIPSYRLKSFLPMAPMTSWCHCSGGPPRAKGHALRRRVPPRGYLLVDNRPIATPPPPPPPPPAVRIDCSSSRGLRVKRPAPVPPSAETDNACPFPPFPTRARPIGGRPGSVGRERESETIARLVATLHAACPHVDDDPTGRFRSLSPGVRPEELRPSASDECRARSRRNLASCQRNTFWVSMTPRCIFSSFFSCPESRPLAFATTISRSLFFFCAALPCNNTSSWFVCLSCSLGRKAVLRAEHV